MDNLTKLLVDLGRDAELEARYRSDRDDVIAEYGLSDEAAEALKKGDLDALRKLSGLDELRLTNSTVKAYR